jgi:antitoxin component YwqK of YwqJK toxin-antitoxin module
MPLLGIACLIMTGCASPGATGSGKDAQSKQSQANAVIPDYDYMPYPEGYCDNLPTETNSEITPEGMKVEQESAIEEDGTLIAHGLTRHYWENGQVKLEMYHRCGLKHSTKKAYFPDGEPWNEGAYINGKGTGIWREWHVNGFMAQEFTLVDGAWHGLQTGWHQTGKKRLQVAWVAGNRQGIMKIWDEEGTLRRLVDFVDGEVQPSPLALFSVIDTE